MTKLPLIVGAIAMATTAMVTGSTSTAHADDAFLLQDAQYDGDMARTRTRNGVEVLRATDEEMTVEQASFAIDPADPTRGVVIMMSTTRLDSEAGPHTGADIEVGRMQLACLPFTISKDETTETGIRIDGDKANYKYITQRQADEYRAANHPHAIAMPNGYFAALSNWDRNDNTNTEEYIKVIDAQCNIMPLSANTNVTRRENNTSAVVMAKNNDNCSMRQAGGGGEAYADGDGICVVSSAGCNGNGRDDGWQNQYCVYPETDGSFNVQKIRDVSYIRREERSRGFCSAMDLDGEAGADTGVCCGTEGNSQPQREGVWCQGTSLSTGEVLWKEMVAYRDETADGRRTYAMRMKVAPEITITGEKTGNLILQYQDHRGNNNNNQKGGYDAFVKMHVASPSLEGLNLGPAQDITQQVIDTQVEMTHASIFQSWHGSASNPEPGLSFFSGNHNGSGTVNAHVLNVGFNTTERSFRSLAKTTLSSPADAQKYSKYLGNNPNNQGRNFIQCKTIVNPFAGDADGKASGIPVLNACAVTGKLTTAGMPQYKPDMFFSVWSTLSKDPVDEPGGDGDGDGSGNGDGNGDGGDNGGGGPNELGGGCSTTGGAGGLASLLLVGLVLGFRRRRN
jgi:uncharacterized protein (TIGR03382 family)